MDGGHLPELELTRSRGYQVLHYVRHVSHNFCIIRWKCIQHNRWSLKILLKYIIFNNFNNLFWDTFLNYRNGLWPTLLCETLEMHFLNNRYVISQTWLRKLLHTFLIDVAILHFLKFDCVELLIRIFWMMQIQFGILDLIASKNLQKYILIYKFQFIKLNCI